MERYPDLWYPNPEQALVVPQHTGQRCGDAALNVPQCFRVPPFLWRVACRLPADIWTSITSISCKLHYYKFIQFNKQGKEISENWVLDSTLVGLLAFRLLTSSSSQEKKIPKLLYQLEFGKKKLGVVSFSFLNSEIT